MTEITKTCIRCNKNILDGDLHKIVIYVIQEKFTLGAAYRWDAAMSALAGFQVNDNWFIGYGYDAEVTILANYNSGSHELFLRYEFSRKKQVASPRFF